jgi:hypothetical protein
MSSGLRPLSTGQVLDRSFQIYRKNFVLFAGISALPHVALLAVQLSMLALTFSNGSTALAIVLGIVGLIAFVVQIAASGVATAATTFGVSDIYLDRPTSIGACFRRVRGKVTRVIFTSIEYGLRVGLGMLLLLIPGFYFLGKWGLAIPVVVLEDSDRKKAFPRAVELSKDSVGRVLVVYFIAYVLILSVSMGLAFLLAAIAPTLAKAAGTVASQAVQFLLAAIVNTVVTPVMSIALTVLYYDQRVRKEAFDIQNLLAMVTATTGSSNETSAAVAGSN